MALRKVMLAAVVATAASIMPAVADDTTAGFNADYAGAVAVAHTEDIELANETTSRVAVIGDCTFAGALTPWNTLIIQYAGSATATTLSGTATPLVTQIECEINNFASGGLNSQKRDVLLNGSASAVADSTLAATDGPKEWPVLPVTECVSGFAVYGPLPVRIVTLPRKCETPG